MSDRTLKAALHIVGIQSMNADCLRGLEEAGDWEVCSRQTSPEKQPLLP